MTFLRDLQHGRDGEEIVRKLFAKHGISAQKNTTKGHLSDFDLTCVHKKLGTFTVEVKNDLYAKKSGNIAIEVFNPRSIKCSGTLTTLANLWIHIACDGVYCVGLGTLSKYIQDYPPKKVIHAAGDGNATVYLYKMIPSIFIRLDTLSSAKLIKALLKCLEE